MTQDYADLYGVFPVDFDSITETLKNTTGNGVISGFDSSVTGTNLTVTIASGSARVAGTKFTFAGATNIDFTGNVDTTFPKKALIVIDSTGLITKRIGVAAAANPSGQSRRTTVTPDPPELNVNDIVLHEVWLSAGTTAIVAADVSDRRITITDYIAPAILSVGSSSAIGTSQLPADALHKHGIPTGTPVSLGAANAAGGSTSFADLAHIHQRSIEVQSSGILAGVRRLLNFTGAIVTDDGINDRINVAVSGAGHTIKDEGIALTQRTNLNFIGAAVTASDNVATNSTDVLINPSGIAGYYGQRAIDYITIGNGTDANPYNASAIESAINALPDIGGFVFVKAGIWRGSRILIGAVGQAGRGKYIRIIGEGAPLFYDGSSGTPNFSSQVGTHIQCGFDIEANTTFVDFLSVQLSPNPSLPDTPTLKYYMNGADAFFNQQRMMAGFHIEDCKFQFGHPALWVTGINVDQYFDPHQDFWLMNIKRCGFWSGGTGIKMDKGDGTQSGGFFGEIDLCNLNGRGTDTNTPGIDIQIENFHGKLSNLLIEGCGGTGGQYALYLSIFNAQLFSLENISFGDGSSSANDAFIEFLGQGGIVRGFNYGGLVPKNVVIRGYGDFELGGQGTVNVTLANGVTLRRIPGASLTIGTNNNPANVKIVREVSTVGLIGTTVPSISPFTYTNNDSYAEMVYLVGGAITGITRNGTSIGTAISHFLAPGDSIIITYSSAPNIVRYGVS